MTPKPPARAYSYVRFSTDEQKKGDSKRRQTQLAADYCARHALTLDTDLALSDLGVSAYRGKNAETGALKGFRDAIEAGDIPAGSVLLVENFDRISRKAARAALNIIGEIADGGVDIVTLQDGKRYTAESLNGMDGMIAFLTLMRGHEESRTKATRLREKWDQKRIEAAKSRKVATAVVPAWIRAVGRTYDAGGRITEAGKLAAVPERAKVVKRIFQLFVGGLGKQGIAQRLNAEKVPCFGRAQFWHRSYVEKILRSSTVVGVFTPHEDKDIDGKVKRVPKGEPVPGYYPRVIDDELWTRAQAMLDAQGRSNSPGVVQNVLAGLARCPKCGGTMTRINKGKGGKAGVPKLLCVRAKNRADCTYRTVPLDLIEAALVKHADAFARNLPRLTDDLAEHISAREQDLEDIGFQLTGLADMASRNPSDTLAKRIVALEKKRDALSAELSQLGLQAAETESQVLKRRAERLRAALKAKKLDRASVNAALREAFEAATVDYGQGDLVLRWKRDGEMRVTYDLGATFKDLGPRSKSK